MADPTNASRRRPRERLDSPRDVALEETLRYVWEQLSELVDGDALDDAPDAVYDRLESLREYAGKRLRNLAQ